MPSVTLRSSTQQLLGFGFGSWALFHTPEVHSAPGKIVAAAGTGLLVWLFSKTAGQIADRSRREALRSKKTALRAMGDAIKIRHYATPRTSKTPQALVKLTATQSKQFFSYAGELAKSGLIRQFAKTATACCTYYLTRPAIVHEIADRAAKFLPR